MWSRIINQNPQATILLAILTLANLATWGGAMVLFHNSATMMAASLLAWCYGLRHAVDADHIAAIDNVTRKMMQQGQRPWSVGVWFSLGHSSIVTLASAIIAFSAGAFQKNMPWFHNIGGIIGTAVSSFFLLSIAFINLDLLKECWCDFRKFKRKALLDERATSLFRGGMVNKLFKPMFSLIGKSWHMYLIGILFGLGFDTATEIGVLGISAASASTGISVWSVLVFPALFASGMALVDTLDNIIMINAYDWAINKPQRRLYYNITMTGTSVVVALFIGGIEAMGLMVNLFDLQQGVWGWVSMINARLSNAGFFIVLLFIICWLISVVNYRVRGYDSL